MLSGGGHQLLNQTYKNIVSWHCTWDYSQINSDFFSLKANISLWMYTHFNGYPQDNKPMFPLSSFAGPSGYTMRYYRRFVKKIFRYIFIQPLNGEDPVFLPPMSAVQANIIGLVCVCDLIS